ncbi:synembryn [Aphis craccivora]|uniref:Synembryn n=1 Tax=Aphis craccivora TaxID=307492 RepID=A0A6G0ZKD7_APHCR|nr:synembryn [Aphis craccivora]
MIISILTTYIKTLERALFLFNHTNTFSFDAFHADNTFKHETIIGIYVFLRLTVKKLQMNSQAMFNVHSASKENLSYNKRITHYCPPVMSILFLDKTHFKDIVIEKHINILLHCANIFIIVTQHKKYAVLIKLLTTLFLDYEHILNRIFHMLKITEELHGLTYLTEVLDNILPGTIEDSSKNNLSSLQYFPHYPVYNLKEECFHHPSSDILCTRTKNILKNKHIKTVKLYCTRGLLQWADICRREWPELKTSFIVTG